MRDQDQTCETCRYWRRLTEHAIVGDCRKEEDTGRSFTRAAERCACWALHQPAMLSESGATRKPD